MGEAAYRFAVESPRYKPMAFEYGNWFNIPLGNGRQFLIYPPVGMTAEEISFAIQMLTFTQRSFARHEMEVLAAQEPNPWLDFQPSPLSTLPSEPIAEDFRLDGNEGQVQNSGDDRNPEAADLNRGD